MTTIQDFVTDVDRVVLEIELRDQQVILECVRGNIGSENEGENQRDDHDENGPGA